MEISKVAEQVGKKSIPQHVNSLVLEMCCSTEDGEDVYVPYIIYHLKNKIQHPNNNNW